MQTYTMDVLNTHTDRPNLKAIMEKIDPARNPYPPTTTSLIHSLLAPRRGQKPVDLLQENLDELKWIF